MRTIVWSLPPIAPHGRWRRQLDAYLDGELSAPAERRFARHLSGCARCGAALSEARAVKTLFATLPEEPAPRSFAVSEAMLAPVPAPSARTAAPSPAYGALRWASGVAAAAVVFALGVLVVVDVGGGGGSQMASPTSLEASAAGDFDRTGATPATGGGTDDDTNVESADDDSGADGADEASGQPPLGESEGGSRSRAARATPVDAEPEALNGQASPDITNAAAGGASPAEIADAGEVADADAGRGDGEVAPPADEPDSAEEAPTGAAEEPPAAAGRAAAGQAELSGDVAVQDGRLDAASDSTFGALRIAQIALGATALIAFVTTVALWRRAKGIHT